LRGRKIARVLFLLISIAKAGGVARPVGVQRLKVDVRAPRTTILRWISEAAELGLVEVRSSGRSREVILSERGKEFLINLIEELQAALESSRVSATVTGMVFSGLGEGAYYVSREGYKRGFRELLGYTPFPGTLNLRLASSTDVEAVRKWRASTASQVIQAFSEGGRTFGSVRIYPVRIVGCDYPTHALFAERRHYGDDVLELISPVNLRETLGIKDGDLLNVELL